MSWVKTLEFIDKSKFKTCHGTYGSSLLHYLRFVKKDMSVIQSHQSPNDVDDMIDVMNVMYKYDGKFWDDEHSFLATNTKGLFCDVKMVA